MIDYDKLEYLFETWFYDGESQPVDGYSSAHMRDAFIAGYEALYNQKRGNHD